VYRVGVSGGAPQRVTFDGGYNVSPHLSPDGKLLAYVTRQGSAYRVAVLDLASGQTQIVSDGPRDESPSFAPNGRMIVYASEVGGRGILQATSSDGRIRQRLSVPAADVREPAWGPFLNQ
jgi:TolB protein